MGDPLHCAICQAPATVHLTRIADGKIHKVHLCEHCAGHHGPAGHGQAENPLPELAGLLAELRQAPAAPAVGAVCPECGLSEADLRKKARLGCAHCYPLFASGVQAMLPRIQPGLTHTGKHPAGARIHAARAELTRRRDALRRAVKAEHYEAAAAARDAIASLEAEIASLEKSA